MSYEGELAADVAARPSIGALGRPAAALRSAVRLGAEGKVLVALLAMRLILAVGFALITPSLKGYDEIGHLDYVQMLWDTRGDRSTWSSVPEPPTSERDSQPPTYYWVVSPAYALTKGQPQEVQVAAIRLTSAFLLLAEVVLAFLVARLLSPSEPFVYLATTAIVALTPGRVWIASMIENDNMAALASAAALYLFVRWVLRDFEWKTLAGLVAAMAVLPVSKVTALPVLAVLALVVAAILVGRLWMWGMRRSWPITACVTLAGVILSVAIACSVWGPAMDALEQLTRGGVSLVRVNWDRLGQVPTPSLEPFVIQFRSFWFPIWEDDYGMPGAGFQLALALVVVALLGLVLRVLWGSISCRRRRFAWGPVVCIFVLATAAIAVWMLPLLYYLRDVAGTSSFIAPGRSMSWTTSHARYLYPAMIPIAYLLSLGLGRLVPCRLRSLGLVALVALLLHLDGAALFDLVSHWYWWAS